MGNIMSGSNKMRKLSLGSFIHHTVSEKEGSKGWSYIKVQHK